MADLTISVEIDGSKTKSGADEANRAVKSIGDEAEKTAKRTQSLAKVDYSGAIQQLKQYGDQIKNVGSQITSAGQSLALNLTVPILGLMLLIGGLGISYESALNTFQAVTKATAEEMRQASQVAKELGADVTLPATSAKDAALAMAELGKAGMTAAQSMAAAKGVLQLAAAGQIEEAKAAEIAANALNSFNLKAEDSVRVADLLAAASNASSAEVTDVAESFSQASATFAAAKVPIEDLTTAIAIMANAGIKGSDAGTSLKTFLSSLQAPSKTGADALQNLGVKVFDLQGRMKSLPDIIGQFEKSLAGLTDEKKVQAIQDIFGSDASRAAQILFRDGAAGFDKIKQAVTLTGAAADLAAAKTKGLGGAWESLKSQAETIGITIFDALKTPAEQAVRFLADKLGQVSDFLSKLAENNPQIIQIGAVFLGLVAAIAPVLIILGTLISFIGSVVGAVGTLAPMFATVAGVIASFGGFIISFIGLIGQAGLVASFSALASVVGTTVVGAIGSFLTAIAPVVAGVLAVAAVIGLAIAAGVALYAAYQSNFGGLRDFTNEVFASIQVYIQTALANIQAWWATYGEQIIQTATDAFNGLVEFLRPVVTEIVNFMREGFQALMEVAAPIWTQLVAFIKTQLTILSIVVRAVLAYISDFWKAHGEQIKSIVSAVWTILKTIVLAGIRQIGNIITLVLSIINGDWASAWQAFKNIVQTGVNASITILKSLGTLIVSALSFVVTRLYNIGKDIIQGLINGIKAGAGAVYDTVAGIASRITGTFRSVLNIQSPSKETTEIGEFISEGLVVGMESKSARVISAARKLAADVIKELKDAVAEFNKLAGASPDTVRKIQQTNTFRDAANNQQEIIKLRGELGVNQFQSLPTTPSGTDRELKYLQALKQAAEDFDKSLEEISNGYDEMQELIAKQQEAFDKRILSIQQNGELAVINLQEEIELIGITDDFERERVKNFYEIQRLREQMSQDGFGAQQIEETAEVLRLEQARQIELQKILQVRKQVAAAGDVEKNLLGELSKLRDGNRELSEYEKTLQKINTDLKDISPAQKEYLLNLAQQVDQQKAFNEQYKQTYDFIRGALDVLTDSGTSFGEKMKKIFGSIFDSFKKMLLDMAAQWLTSKLFGSGSNGSGSGGFSLGNILNGLFGGGRNGGSGGNGGGGGFNLGTIFGGNAGNGIFNFGGGGRGGGSSIPSHEAGHIGGGFGGGGLAGGLAIGGTAANIIGNLIGGRVGSFISNIGSGVATGAMIGSIVPGIGTAIGAVIGGGIGLLQSILGGDPKRKADKKENMPKLQQGFNETFNQLRQLAADKNALFSDPAGTLARAKELRAQIESGFGIRMESKKYRGIAQQQIKAKLVEADQIIANITKMSDEARTALDTDARLQTSFAGGVYMDAAFLNQYKDFKRRNGMLPGAFTGKDTLPSMLAAGEMVLNPTQIQAVIRNAGNEDVFKNSGIPGYAGGAFLAPAPSAPVSSPSGSASNESKQPIVVNVHLNNTGLVESDIEDIIVDSFDRKDVQVKVVQTYDKGKSRRIN